MRNIHVAQPAPHPEQCIECGADIIHEVQIADPVWIHRLKMEHYVTTWFNLPCGHAYHHGTSGPVLTPEEIAVAYLMVQND